MEDFKIIGGRYKGIGSSGMTDGVPVEGILIEVVGEFWYCILKRDDGMECAVYSYSLKLIN